MRVLKFKIPVLFCCTFLFFSNLLADELLPGQSRPFGWVYLGRAKPDELVTFSIYLRQPREEEFNEIAKKTSDPRSELYAQYWSLEQLREFLKVPESTYAEVDAWFSSRGLPISMCNREWDRYDCKRIPVKDAEHLLQVKIGIYDYNSGQRRRLMTEDKPNIPSSSKCVIGIRFEGPGILSRLKKRK